MTFLLKVMADGINLYLFHVKWEVLIKVFMLALKYQNNTFYSMVGHMIYAWIYFSIIIKQVWTQKCAVQKASV
jgi:hypothetical protein